jgi:uncharacterized membrane protein
MTPAALAWLVLLASAGPSSGPATAAPAAVERRLGELVRAGDALAFASCGESAAAAVDADPVHALAPLVRELNGGSDGGAFLDADMAREPDGRWGIRRLHRIYRDGPRCRERLGEFVLRAAGDAAGWTLEATRRYVTIRRPGQRAAFYRYRPFAAADRAWTFSASGDAGPVLVVLRAAPCALASTGLRSTWSLEFTLAGTRYIGCAWSGQP